MLALLLGACEVIDCLPLPDSGARTELRARLHPLVRFSQCPGPPTPARFQAQQLELSRRKTALLERVGRSRVAEDLARVRREAEEASRYVNEADCAMTFWNEPEAPANVAAWPAIIAADRRELQAAEAAFARVMAGCEAG